MQELVGGSNIAIVAATQACSVLDDFDPVCARNVIETVSIARGSSSRKVGVRDVEREGGASMSRLW